jgi:hypothetical protein
VTVEDVVGAVAALDQRRSHRQLTYLNKQVVR